MGSATPSLNAWSRIQSGNISCQRMSQRHNQFALPKISLVDLKKEFKAGNYSVFSRELKDKMQDEISKGNQVILFVNRRGHSSFVMCRKCSHTLTCPRCDLSLTYHDSDVLCIVTIVVSLIPNRLNVQSVAQRQLNNLV